MWRREFTVRISGIVTKSCYSFPAWSVFQSLSPVQLFVTLWTAAFQASLSFHYLPEFAQTHVHWVSDDIQTISFSVVPFPSCPQSFPASFPMSWLFPSSGQSASLAPMNIQGWFHLGLTGLISLLSKGLLRVFSSTTVQCTGKESW